MTAVQIIFPGRPLGDTNAIDTVAELRALDSTDVNDNTNIIVADKGIYKWNPSSITDDDGSETIKPDDRTTLQAGRWIRILDGTPSGVASVTDFGAVPDCTAVGVGTDNYQAFRDAIDSLGDAGGLVFVPRGRYRISQRLDFTTAIHLVGEKIGQNPGVIDGVVYGGVTFLYGSVLVFDANTAGLYFLPHTSEVNQNTVKDDIALNGNNSIYWQYPSSDRSHVENITLISSGTSDTGKRGIESRVRITLEHLVVRGFAGSGVHVWGSSDGTYDGVIPYGIANMSYLCNIRSVLNKGDGFYVGGRDANGIALIDCDSSQNGGWGFSDEGFLGNIYVGGQTAGCGLGSYRATSAVAPHEYFGCYVETSAGTGVIASLTAACTVHGGQLASAQCHAADSQALIMQGGLLEREPFKWTNNRGAVNVKLWLGFNDTTMSVLGFGADGALDAYKLRYDNTNSWWNLRYAGATGTTALQLPQTTSGLRSTANGGGFGPSFPGGFYLGGIGFGGGLKQHVNTGTAAAASGTWIAGDLILSSTPATGGQLGFACITGGTPGTWWKAGTLFLDAQTTWDPASIANGASASTTVAVTGAAVGDYAQASFGNSQAGLIMAAYVSAADTVTVTLGNLTGAAVDLSNGTLRVRVTRRGT